MNSKSRDSWSPDPAWIGFIVTLSLVSYKCSKRGDSNLFHGNVLVSLCNIRPPVFTHRSDIERQLETGGRGRRRDDIKACDNCLATSQASLCYSTSDSLSQSLLL